MAFLINKVCDGCGACSHQCPTAAIFGVFEQRYDVDAQACIDCGVCGQICPIEAVVKPDGTIAAFVARDQRLRPVVNMSICNGCGLCREFCPFACIDRVGKQYSGVAYLARPEQCVSCGECVVACIKGAVEMRPLDLRRYRPEDRRAELHEALLFPREEGAQHVGVTASLRAQEDTTKES